MCGVQLAAHTFNSASVVVPAISSTTLWLTSGLPRQLAVMNENSRCSMRFHLLVPGGRWHTVIGMPSSSASLWSSSFHSRTRDPLLPPPSAVITRRVACG
jgi:hypothetical protein